MVHSALERGTVDEVSLATARYDFMRGAVDAADVVRAATEHVSPRTPLLSRRPHERVLVRRPHDRVLVSVRR